MDIAIGCAWLTFRNLRERIERVIMPTRMFAIPPIQESFPRGIFCAQDDAVTFLMKFAVDSTQAFLYQPPRGWRGGRVVEGAPLLREYTS